ncbi:hypothetical protein OsJ_24198 [Oryza sativa Japonica Group]|uniref:Uncharacterized protein n=1 Tax=Oryza sativa subsp. japonica TaxID=39947 RepID=A3BJM1_ORYSJ|nr:hypothetical protein OsJ_24198 [Oryza sativa Japonica Group]
MRWLSAAAAAAAAAASPEESMLRPEWLVVEVLVKEVMVALDADRSSSAPDDDVRWWWCWCAAAIVGCHRGAVADGGGSQLGADAAPYGWCMSRHQEAAAAAEEEEEEGGGGAGGELATEASEPSCAMHCMRVVVAGRRRRIEKEKWRREK